MIWMYLSRVLSSTFMDGFFKSPLSRVTRSCSSFDKFLQNKNIFLCILIEVKKIKFFIMVIENKHLSILDCTNTCMKTAKWLLVFVLLEYQFFSCIYCDCFKWHFQSKRIPWSKTLQQNYQDFFSLSFNGHLCGF